MAGQIAMHDANIIVAGTGPEFADRHEYLGHQVLVRNGRANIRTRGGTLIRERAGVVSTKRDPDTGGWSVTFTDDETWSVVAVIKKCGACA